MAQRSITAFFKPSSVSSSVNGKRASDSVTKFEKKQKISSSDETKPVDTSNKENLAKDVKVFHQKIMNSAIGTSWFEGLREEFNQPYFQKLTAYVEAERKRNTVYPPEEDVFSWTRYCDISDVKVVILGQDPYHGPKQAHGLCFSVQPNVLRPPSLRNMYKELENDIKGFETPGHGHLIGWAQQGVLLLNAVLTVVSGKPNSHRDQGWETFTTAVIKKVAQRNKGVIFFLWGAYAQKKAACIDKNEHHLLSAVHPSPLSASRGFFGCKHFSRCNELLESQGKSPIRWSHLPKE